jgi:uncharacterized coiled-coil protein SlyX
MKLQVAILAAAGLFTAMLAPAHVYSFQANQVEQHHPATADAPDQAAPTPQNKPMGMMAASSAKLDALVKKMNAAKGSEKTDAIAELLSALVQDRAMCEQMMTNMSAMMNNMGGAKHDTAAPGRQ